MFLIFRRKNRSIFVTSAIVSEAGFNRSLLNHLAKQGKLERVAVGVYVTPDTFEDTYYVAQCRYPRGVFADLSALFLHDLTDLTPFRPYMVFPFGYNTTKPKSFGIDCASAAAHIYEMGIAEAVTPSGHAVRCYSPEKTLCDILRPKSRAYPGIIGEAWRRCIKRGNIDYGALMDYAKALKVEDKVFTYLEAIA